MSASTISLNKCLGTLCIQHILHKVQNYPGSRTPKQQLVYHDPLGGYLSLRALTKESWGALTGDSSHEAVVRIQE